MDSSLVGTPGRAVTRGVGRAGMFRTGPRGPVPAVDAGHQASGPNVNRRSYQATLSININNRARTSTPPTRTRTTRPVG